MASYAIRFKTEISVDVHASSKEDAVQAARDLLGDMEPGSDFLGGYNSKGKKSDPKIVFVGINEDCEMTVEG